jgi:hypothetical protein
MERNSNLDHASPATAAKPAVGVAVHGTATNSPFLHPPVDGGHSLAEMAQHDLDAALQLLADRAQYITGASGAAIALRRDGKKDMLCRASTGPNAPELGALLSTEIGLSGESVRTRQPLRCDDAERDLRVNREVCRQMGIASVVVMPVVNDDEVLGVFELFSGKANAFGARDLSAVQRLSEMVETAVRLAQATESLRERLKMPETFAPELKGAAPEVQAPDVEAPDFQAAQAKAAEAQVAQGQALEAHPEDGHILPGQLLADIVLDDPILDDPILDDPILDDRPLEGAALEVVTDRVEIPTVDASAAKGGSAQESPAAAAGPLKADATAVSPEPRQDVGATAPLVEKTSTESTAENAPPKKTLFWSAAMNSVADAETAVEPDQSHVPPMLRSLRKCEACGFPVSAGRALCVECEEKKWRGQLRVSKAGAPRPTAMPAEKAAPPVKPEARAFAAAAQAATPSTLSETITVPVPSGAVTAPPARKDDRAMTAATPSNAAAREIKSIPAVPTSSVQTSSVSAKSSAARASVTHPAMVPAPEFVFSAGLEPSQSWFATHKYIVGVLLVVGGAAAAFFLLR